MGLGNTLTILIPFVVLAYALWLIIRMIRDRKKGKCGLGGCAGCPVGEGCKIAKQVIIAEAPGRPLHNKALRSGTDSACGIAEETQQHEEVPHE